MRPPDQPRPSPSSILFYALALAACGDPSGTSVTSGTSSESDTGTSGSTTTTSGTDSDASSSSATSSATETSTTTGEPGLVEVRRDAHGVPHVLADTDAGAFYGLGWASASDRLLQMNLGVLTAQGRLAEHFGPEHVDADKRMRAAGLWRHAQAAADALPSEHRALLQAFSDGVNDRVAAYDALDPVFAEVGVTPQTWTPAHCLAAWYRVAEYFTPTPEGKAELYEEYLALAEMVGPEVALETLIGAPHPGDPSKGVVQAADVPKSVQDAITAYAAGKGYAGGALPDFPHESPKFSHAWAIGGARTSTGQAMLLSNPQVSVAYPNLFYEWQMSSPTVEARGLGIPGAAALLLGYTDGVAWGLTAAGLDQRDLYRLDMVDETHYLVDGEMHEITSEPEEILVKGAAPVVLAYRSSVWGPVVSRVLTGTALGEYALHGIPFAEPDRDTFVGALGMLRAKDLAGLRAAAAEWRYPSANLVAAGGPDIFYTVIGAVPLRSPDSPGGGVMAQDGGTTANAWVDTIPDEFKPWVQNPAAGYVLSANHRPAGDWYPLPLGSGTGSKGDTIRSRRLREVVSALPPGATPAAIIDGTQWDCVNAAQRDLATLAAHVDALDPAALSAGAAAAVDALQPWLGGGGSKETGPGEVLLAHNIDVKFRLQQIGPILQMTYGGGENGLNFFLETMLAAIADDPLFMPSADEVAYLDSLLAAAWKQTQQAGADPSAWATAYEKIASPHYGFMDTIELPDLMLLPPFVPGVLACADGNTIWSQAGETYAHHVDLAAIADARSVMPPGGPELGPTALSQADAWLSGTFKPAPLGPAIDAIVESTESLAYPP
ncbi:MAG: penicillin acylase family protein [Nannocystaceae bacterium]